MTSLPKAADSGSLTVKVLPTLVKTSSRTVAGVPVTSNVAGSLTDEARTTTVLASIFGSSAGTTSVVQLCSSVGTGVANPCEASRPWFKTPPLAVASVVRVPVLSRKRSSVITCSLKSAFKSFSKVTLNPAKAALTWSFVPWNCNIWFSPFKVTVTLLPAAGRIRTPPPPKPVA